MTALPHEHALFLFLDRGNRPIGALAITQGKSDHVTVPVEAVFALARALHASAMIVIHNHPSGILRASMEDIAVTAALMEHARDVGIDLLDHWLIAAGQSRSILGEAHGHQSASIPTSGMLLCERSRLHGTMPEAGDTATPWRGADEGIATSEQANKDIAFIRTIMAMRQSRTTHIPISQMGDAAWDILLDVYACQLEGVKLPVTAVGTLAGIPAATAQRWIKRLTQQGMLAQIADPKDRRRSHVLLSPKACDAMRAWHADVCAMLAAC